MTFSERYIHHLLLFEDFESSECTCCLRRCSILLMSRMSVLCTTASLCAKAGEGGFIVCADSLYFQCMARPRGGTKKDWSMMATIFTRSDSRIFSCVSRPRLNTKTRGAPARTSTCTLSPAHVLHTGVRRTHSRSVHQTPAHECTRAHKRMHIAQTRRRKLELLIQSRRGGFY